MVRNFKLTIAYEGTNYRGWQSQLNKPTVQNTIEEAISIITKQKIDLIGSGRTDKGVHALGQVANFIADTKIENSKVKIAINSKLPKDIRIIQSEEVPLDFHSRFDAHNKTYMYNIYNDRVSSPFYSNYSYFVPYVLDFKAMEKAAEIFIGTHDFKGFMSTGSNFKTTVRTIYKTSIKSEGKIIRFHITGNGFLYNMVRIMVGTLIDIGRGKKEIKCIEKAFNEKDRLILGKTARPEGLFLKEVSY